MQVIVEDVNDHDPVFLESVYTATIAENNYEGRFLVQVSAIDGDTGPNAKLHFSIPKDARNKFHIDEFRGSITAKASLDYEGLQEVCKTLVNKKT